MLRRPSLDVWELNQAGKEIILWENFDLRLDIFFQRILSFFHFLNLDLGQNKVALAFRQCPIVKYLIKTFDGTRDCPLETFGGPLGVPIVSGNSQKNASNHQILLFPPLKQATPSFPIVEYFISTSHGTLGQSLEALGDPQGL